MYERQFTVDSEEAIRAREEHTRQGLMRDARSILRSLSLEDIQQLIAEVILERDSRV